MIKTTYQRPELRDANDNIIQSGSFGKNTALSNATNDGWIDYTMNDLEALHDSMSGVETVTTPKVATSDYLGKIWFSDTNNGARLCRSDDLTYNPAVSRLGAKTIYVSGNNNANISVDGGYLTMSGNSVGRLIITLPFSAGTTTGYRMIRFMVHIFNWADSEYTTYVIAGGNRINTLAWSYSRAYAMDNNMSSRPDLPVAFGNDGSSPYIAIGNADTSWNYSKVLITDFMGAPCNAPFSITVSDAELQNVDNVVRYNSVVEPANGTPAHNAPHKGKNLGSSITDEQLAAIHDGTFRGINVGDYWLINNTYWYVAGVNYFRLVGTTGNIVNSNHIVIVPNQVLYRARMNATATTDGGYVGSELFAGLETNALPIIESAFGASNILAMYRRLPSTCVGGEYTASADYTGRKVDLMNEVMVLGSHSCGQNRFSDGTQSTQLPLFQYRRDLIKSYDIDGSSRFSYWLYDVVNDNNFAYVNYAYANVASANANVATLGVRPFFCVG